MRYFILGSMLVLLGVAAQGVSADHVSGHTDHADHAHETRAPVSPENPKERKPVVVELHQAIVEVQGVVCSFCAYGVEKKLGKLSGLDKNQFKRGVFTDIQNQRLTLALKPGRPIQLKEIQEAIQQAGYEMKRIHLRLTGPVQVESGQMLLQHQETGQTFHVGGERIKWDPGMEATVQVHIDTEQIVQLNKGQPIPVMIDRMEEKP